MFEIKGKKCTAVCYASVVEPEAFLSAHPLCEECLKHGRYMKATVVDHIVPHRGDPKLFWARNNWRALCKKCHDEKTGREDPHPVYRY